MKDDRLEGDHIVVTGGAQGIGRGIATRAAQAGGNITIFDIEPNAAQETAEVVEDQGSRSHVEKVDVSCADDVQAGVDGAIDALGPIDGLVNNAGIQRLSPILETTEESWDAHFDANAKGTFLCAKSVGSHMVNEGTEGSIVNIASTAAGLLPHAGQGAYAATKAAIETFSIVLAKELSDHGITSNVISPGGVETAMLDRSVSSSDGVGPSERSETSRESITERFLVGRLGRPEDIGHMATLLLSDEGEWITGQTFVVDGGVVHSG